MKRVLYVDGSFITGTAIADGLLELVATLGQRGTSDVVHFPVVDDLGHTRTLDLVIGPASQIRAEKIATELPDPDPEETLAKFDEIARMSGVLIAHPEPASSVRSDDYWIEEL